ncbi:hypothetical protein EV122DRAFT_189255, partial [Schizophyllum commune]
SVFSRICTLRAARHRSATYPARCPPPRRNALTRALSTDLSLNKLNNPMPARASARTARAQEPGPRSAPAGRAPDGFAPGCGRLACRNRLELEEGCA